MLVQSLRHIAKKLQELKRQPNQVCVVFSSAAIMTASGCLMERGGVGATAGGQDHLGVGLILEGSRAGHSCRQSSPVAVGVSDDPPS